MLLTRLVFSFPDWVFTLQPMANVLAQVFMCASILMLVALTWERHFAICSPHQYRIHIRTTSRWRHLCRYFVPVTLCSFLFNIPTFINVEVIYLFYFLFIFPPNFANMYVIIRVMDYE